MFRFASPWFFLLLMALPLVFFWRKRRHAPVHVMASHGTPSDIQPTSFVLMFSAMLPVFKYAAVALMIVALARPQWGTRKMNVSTEGINIVLALDLSQSMAALDFKRDGKIISRLDAVKGVVNDFIMKRNQDRIGMVVFGSQAFTQLPLTRDYNTISFMLDHLKIERCHLVGFADWVYGIFAKRRLKSRPKAHQKPTKKRTKSRVFFHGANGSFGDCHPPLLTTLQSTSKKVKRSSLNKSERY